MIKDRKPLEMMNLQKLDADELKRSVREFLVLMNAAERKVFLTSLEDEMRRTGLSIKRYLIPLGIAAAYVEDLTPNEVGHLIRFFRINVPQAMSAVLRALRDCSVVGTPTPSNG
jgi:hypothetical protein